MASVWEGPGEDTSERDPGARSQEGGGASQLGGLPRLPRETHPHQAEATRHPPHQACSRVPTFHLLGPGMHNCGQKHSQAPCVWGQDLVSRWPGFCAVSLEKEESPESYGDRLLVPAPALSSRAHAEKALGKARATGAGRAEGSTQGEGALGAMPPLSTRCRARPGRAPGHVEQKGPRRLEPHTTCKPFAWGLSADHRERFRLEPMDTPNSFTHT